MLDAPKGAYFVWCNKHVDYPIQLSRQLGRSDLKIVAAGWLNSSFSRGINKRIIVIDHAYYQCQD